MQNARENQTSSLSFKTCVLASFVNFRGEQRWDFDCVRTRKLGKSGGIFWRNFPKDISINEKIQNTQGQVTTLQMPLACHRKSTPISQVRTGAGGTGMTQWWEHSPPTNVARVRFPDPASNVGWVCWFFSLHREVFSGYSGFPSPQKPKFDLIVLIVNLIYSVPN